MAELSQVLALTEELDEIAWDVRSNLRQRAAQQAYLAAFARARAAAAVRFALEPDALCAALESVYEAQAATADLQAVRAAFATVLM